MQTQLQTFEHIIKSTEQFIKRGLNPLPAGSAPLLSMPNETRVEGKTGINLNLYYDSQNYLNSIFYECYKTNKYCKLVVDTIGTVATSVEPYYVLNSVKSKRDKTYIERLSKAIDFPNNNDTFYSLFSKVYKSLVNYGNAYIQVIKTKNNELHSFYHIPALTIKPFPYLDKTTGLLRYLFIQVNYIDNFTYNIDRIFSDEEIIHIKMPNHLSELVGLSVFYPLLQDISIDVELNKWLEGYFKNNFNAGLIIQQANTHPDSVERNRQIIQEKFTGGQNSFNVMLLEGEMEIKSTGNKAQDFPLLETGVFNRDTILNCAGVPLSVLGMRSNQSSLNSQIIESEEQSFLRNTIVNYQKIVFSTLNHRLFNQMLDITDISIQSGINNQFARSNATELALTLAKAGAQIDEIRSILGAPPLKDAELGSKYVIMSNNGLIPVEEYFKGLELDTALKQKQLDTPIVQNGNNIKSEPTKQQSLKVSTKGTKLE